MISYVSFLEEKIDLKVNVAVPSHCDYCKAPIVCGVGPNFEFCCHSCELLSDWFKKGEVPLKEKSITGKKISPKWQPYSYPDLEIQYNLSPKNEQMKHFRFYVEGLQCTSCVHLLEELPQFYHGIISSQLNYGRRTLDVESNIDLTLAEIAEAVESLGYIPHPLQEESDREAAAVKENRSDLKRIGVAGAVAGNMMLFSIPLYAGLVGDLATAFKWICFFLFLPLLFYSANVFYKKAWMSLLVRRVNVDMMIVVALWSGFLFSNYSLIEGKDDLYFDSTASFIFLILLTRYFLKTHQDKIYKKNITSDLFLNDVYEVVSGADSDGVVHVDQPVKLNYMNIRPQSIYRAYHGQLLPCDSQLISTTCEIDLSFLTGEVYPQKRNKNDDIKAGSRLLSEQALFKSSALAKESGLVRALNSLDQDKVTANKFQSLTDLVSHKLTLVVFSIAGLFFIITFKTLGYEAFKRSLALITIACPCAVAFGTPLAHSLGLKKALKKGFFIKSENVFEKLNQIHKVIFDKTGTLTSSHLKLLEIFPPNLTEEHKSVILSLEKDSLHPVAQTLKKEWNHLQPAQLFQVTEQPGLGVTGVDGKHRYTIRKAEGDQNNINLQVSYLVDGVPTAYLYFEERLREEAPDLIEYFNQNKDEVFLLSGDIRSRALDLAKKLMIRPSHVLSEQTPEDKKDFIEKQNPCLFVGDGLNDLPALNKAYVSFAVRGPFESTLQVCDIYAPNKNLAGVSEVFEISAQVRKTVQVNLLFAIFYNSLGGVFALVGLINPLVAAILMPISSVLITSHTVWRLK